MIEYNINIKTIDSDYCHTTCKGLLSTQYGKVCDVFMLCSLRAESILCKGYYEEKVNRCEACKQLFNNKYIINVSDSL